MVLSEVQGVGTTEVEHPHVDPNVMLPSLTILSGAVLNIKPVINSNQLVYATITQPGTKYIPPNYLRSKHMENLSEWSCGNNNANSWLCHRCMHFSDRSLQMEPICSDIWSRNIRHADMSSSRNYR